ncbi:MAG: hypothetical protein EOM20_17795, partial [Spartobacteria bacterium]|nr:hypothetical protein [Spartobacteria bacterium]
METTKGNQALYRLNQVGIALTLVLMFLLALTPGISMSEDLGRHLLLGKIIVTQGSIPTTNLLTYTCPDFPFVNHHWLSEVFLYLIHRGVGLNGLIFFKAILLTLALAIPLGMRPVRAVSALYLLAGTLCAILLAYRAHIRPEVFTFIGVAFYGWMLESISYAHSGKRYFGWTLLILYGLVWANAHIYFIFGIGMVGAYVFSLWLFFLARRPRVISAAPWRELLLLVILCLAGCVNPNGLRGLIYPFTIFSNYGIGITENSSPMELWKTVLNPMLLALLPLSLITLYAILRQAVHPRAL